MPMREDRTTGQPLAYPEASFNQPNKPISLRRGKHSLKFVDPHSSEKCGVSAEIQEMESENEMGGLLNADVLHTKKSPSAKELTERSTQTTRLETKQMKGALPDGVFDNKEMIYVPVGTLSDQLDGDRQDLDNVLPANKPSILLFVDRSSDSSETRRNSNEALDALRELALHYVIPYQMGEQKNDQPGVPRVVIIYTMKLQENPYSKTLMEPLLE